MTIDCFYKLYSNFILLRLAKQLPRSVKIGLTCNLFLSNYRLFVIYNLLIFLIDKFLFHIFLIKIYFILCYLYFIYTGEPSPAG